MNKPEDKRQSVRGLELLAQRYFDCLLDEDEEVRFLRRLAMTDESSPVLDEARAVAGYCAVGKRRSAKTFAPVRRLLQMAAAIAVVVAVAAGYMTYGEMPRGECYAYVGGQRVDNDDDVFSIMHRDLSAIEEASSDIGRDVRIQMKTVGNAFDEIEF